MSQSAAPTPRDPLAVQVGALIEENDALRAWVATLTGALERLHRIAEHIAGELVVVPGDNELTDAHVLDLATALDESAAALTGSTPTPAADAREPRGCPTPGACSCVDPAPAADARERIAAAIEAIEELPGRMPDEIWARCSTREAATEVFRAAVRTTKREALAALRPGGAG